LEVKADVLSSEAVHAERNKFHKTGKYGLIKNKILFN
jgi:hypothetical protein